MTLFTSCRPQESNIFCRAGDILTSQVDCGIALELADLVPAIGFFELLVTTGRTVFFVNLGAGALDADRPKRPMRAMMWYLKNFPTTRHEPKTCCANVDSCKL